MELFHKYKNKNFTYLTNYINSCISDENLALSPEELERQLTGTSQSTFEEFIQAILNRSDQERNTNASLLYDKNGKMQPLRMVQVPVRATTAEKAWLYYVLQNSKADLFLDPGLKDRMLDALSRDLALFEYPLQPSYVDIRKLSPDIHLPVTPGFVQRFRTIVAAIQEHRQLIVTNHSYSGRVYADQAVLPYKLEYSAQFDSFSLSCCPVLDRRPVKMSLANLSSVSLGPPIEDYDAFIFAFERQLAETKVKQPIRLEILNQNEAYDRCAYLFSSYDTYCYDMGDDRLIMNIYYYRFQKNEIVRNILFLGHYAKVVSPRNIVDEVIAAIQASYENYC